MGGWKKEYGEDEIEIFEKGLLSKRGSLAFQTVARKREKVRKTKFKDKEEAHSCRTCQGNVFGYIRKRKAR